MKGTSVCESVWVRFGRREWVGSAVAIPTASSRAFAKRARIRTVVEHPHCPHVNQELVLELDEVVLFALGGRARARLAKRCLRSLAA